mgnify:CR=1 FL=1
MSKRIIQWTTLPKCSSSLSSVPVCEVVREAETGFPRSSEESGVLKFGSGRVWLHERTVQNTSAVRDVASSKRLLAKSSKSQSYHAKSA